MKTFYVALMTTVFTCDAVLSLCALGGAIPIGTRTLQTTAFGTGVDIAAMLLGVCVLLCGKD